MENLLQDLETRIKAMIKQHHGLAKQNHQLSQTQRQSIARIETLITKLKQSETAHD